LADGQVVGVVLENPPGGCRHRDYGQKPFPRI
jgi:hypothetical protein